MEIEYKKEKLLLKKSILERMIIQKQQMIDDVLLMTNGIPPLLVSLRIPAVINACSVYRL